MDKKHVSKLLMGFLCSLLLMSCGSEPDDPLTLLYNKYIDASKIQEDDIGNITTVLADVRQRRSSKIKSLRAVETTRPFSTYRAPLPGEKEKPEFIHDIGQYLPLFHLSHLLANSTGAPEHIKKAFWDGVDMFTFYSDFREDKREEEASQWTKITQAISTHGGEDALEDRLRALVLKHPDMLAEDLLGYIVLGGTLHEESPVATLPSKQDDPAHLSRMEIDPSQRAFSKAYIENRSVNRRTLMLAKLLEWTSKIESGQFNEALLAAYIEHNNTTDSVVGALTKADILLFIKPHEAQIAPLAAQLHSDTGQAMAAAFARGDRRLNQMELDQLKLNPVHPLLLNQEGYQTFVASMEILDRINPGSKAKRACAENLIETNRIVARFYLESLEPGDPCLLAQIEASVLGDRSGAFTNLKAVLERYAPNLQQLDLWSRSQFSKASAGQKIDDILAGETKRLGVEAFEFYRARLCRPELDLETLVKKFDSEDRNSAEKLLAQFDEGSELRLLAHDRIRLFKEDEFGMVDALLEAFERCGDLVMANQFLDSDPRLSDAARAWAKAKGYSVFSFDASGVARTVFGEVEAPTTPSRFE